MLLMIFFLCRLFNGTNVDGIHFEEIKNFSKVKEFGGKQKKFKDWLCQSRDKTTRELVQEYIRLTNIAFQVECMEPPVFLLDEVQELCQETTIKSKTASTKHLKVYHTFLSILFTDLAIDEQPICICAGTSDGRIMELSAKTDFDPLVLSPRALALEHEYVSFWKEMTDFQNQVNHGRKNVEFVFENSGSADDQFFESLVYTSYQVPRLLCIAHDVWYTFYSDKSGTREFHLQLFEKKARKYFSEVSQIWSMFSAENLAGIILSCGTHFKVTDLNGFIPGTDVIWSSLIERSLIFPYLEDCYVFPFDLVWNSADKDDERLEVIEACRRRVRNLDVQNLFMPYASLCNLDMYELGIRFESFFASSLAVKYYLQSKSDNKKLLPFTKVYDIGGVESKSDIPLLKSFIVDFSAGIDLPVREVHVNDPGLSQTSVIHNVLNRTAHHDLILPALQNSGLVNIPVSVKSSFKFPEDRLVEDQRRVSKTSNKGDTRIPLLIWLYLESTDKEEKYQATRVVFLNASGCCNGLALDKFIMLKRMRLKEAEDRRQTLRRVATS
jgi:hypothetical protein